jgi:hypothetical protein
MAGSVIPKYGPPGVVPASAEEAADSTDLVWQRMAFKAWREGKRAEIEFNLADVPDDELKQAAYERVIASQAGIADDEVVKQGDHLFRRLLDERAVQLNSGQKKTKLFEQMITPQGMRGDQPLPKGTSKTPTPSEALYTSVPKAIGVGVLDTISTGGRVLQAATAGKLQGYAQRREDLGVSLPPEEIEGLLQDYQRHVSPVVEQREKVLAKDDTYGFPRGNMMRLEFGGTRLQPTPALPTKRTAGLPPDFNDEAIGEGIEAAGNAVFQSSFGDELPQIAKELDSLSKWYKQQALQYVLEKNPELTDEDALVQAQPVFDALIAQDEYSAQLRHPLLTQFITETIGDTVSGNLPTAPLRWGAKLVKAAGKATGATEVIASATRPLRRNPSAALAEIQNAPELASQMRRAQDVGEVAEEMTSKQYQFIDKQFDGLAEEDVLTLSAALDGDETAKALVASNKKLAAKYDEIHALTSTQYAEKARRGQMTRTADDGTFEQAGKIEDYVPKKVKAEPVDPTQAKRGKFRSKGTTGSEQARTGADIDWDPNARTQFAAKAGAETQAAKKAAETAALIDTETGVFINPKAVNADGTSAMKKFVDEAEQTTGLKYQSVAEEISPEVSKEILRLSKGKGKNVGSDWDVYFPEPVVERLKTIYPLVVKQGTDAEKKLAEIAKGFWDFAYKGPMDVWRRTHTLFAGIPGLSQYYMTNTMGAASLGVVGQGIKAANPALQEVAIRSAWAAAGMGDEAALATKYALKSGKELTIGDLVKLAAEDGVTGQSFMKYAQDLRRSKSEIARGLDWVLQKSGANKMNEVIDNYQRLIHYVSALEDVTPAARAAALDFTEKTGGLYRRMSPFEKNVMREVLPFYAWKRAIYPIVTKALMENPQRLQAFERMKMAADRAWNQDRVDHQGTSDFLELPQAVTAFPSMQPDALPEDIKQRTLIGKDASIVFKPDTPIAGLLGDLSPEALQSQMGPLPYALAAGMLGYDIATGEKLPEEMDWFPDLSDMEMIGTAEFPVDMARKIARETKVGWATVAPIQLPLDLVLDLIKVYWDSGQKGEAVTLAMRLGIMRKTGGLDLVVAGGLRALGFDVPGESVGFPGLPGYVNEPDKNKAIYQKQLQERLKSIR